MCSTNTMVCMQVELIRVFHKQPLYFCQLLRASFYFGSWLVFTMSFASRTMLTQNVDSVQLQQHTRIETINTCYLLINSWVDINATTHCLHLNIKYKIVWFKFGDSPKSLLNHQIKSLITCTYTVVSYIIYYYNIVLI